jgi:hypothetical protein
MNSDALAQLFHVGAPKNKVLGEGEGEWEKQ